MRFFVYFLIGVALGTTAWKLFVPPGPAAANDVARAADVTPPDLASSAAAPSASPTVRRDFFVRLTDEADGQPVVSATFFDTDGEHAAPAIVATGIDGVAEWHSVTGSGSEVRVVAEGYAPILFLAKAGRHATRADPLAVGLERAAALVGTARDRDGVPLAAAKIVLAYESRQTLRPRSNFGRSVSRPQRLIATTDADGRFTFESLPPDVELELRVTKAGATTECDVTEVWLDPGERRALDWTLRSLVKVRGRVVAAGGVAVPAAWICIGQPPWPRCVETTGNAVGEFALDDAPAGDAVLRVEAKGESFANIARPIALVEGEERRLDVELPPAAPLIVRAVDTAGKAVAPGHAKVFSAVAGQSFVAASGRELQVQLDHVPLGDVTVRIDPRNDGALAGVEVAFHHDGAHDCVVTLPVAGRAAGRIVDARDGRTPVAATVTALRRGSESSTEALHSVYFIPAPSTFTLESLEPGIYDFLAADDDGRIGLLAGVEICGGATRGGLVIPVAPAAILDVEAPADASIPGGADHFVFQIRSGETRVGVTAVKAHGRAHVLVPPGALTVELRLGRELRATRDVPARAGAQTRVRF